MVKIEQWNPKLEAQFNEHKLEKGEVVNFEGRTCRIFNEKLSKGQCFLRKVEYLFILIASLGLKRLDRLWEEAKSGRVEHYVDAESLPATMKTIQNIASNKLSSKQEEPIKEIKEKKSDENIIENRVDVNPSVQKEKVQGDAGETKLYNENEEKGISNIISYISLFGIDPNQTKEQNIYGLLRQSCDLQIRRYLKDNPGKENQPIAAEDYKDYFGEIVSRTAFERSAIGKKCSDGEISQKDIAECTKIYFGDSRARDAVLTRVFSEEGVKHQSQKVFSEIEEKAISNIINYISMYFNPNETKERNIYNILDQSKDQQRFRYINEHPEKKKNPIKDEDYKKEYFSETLIRTAFERDKMAGKKCADGEISQNDVNECFKTFFGDYNIRNAALKRVFPEKYKEV